MARGDWIKVWVRGWETPLVTDAVLTGGSVGFYMDRDWVTVEERNRVGTPVRTAKFARPDVLGIVEGHDEQHRKKITVRAK